MPWISQKGLIDHENENYTSKTPIPGSIHNSKLKCITLDKTTIWRILIKEFICKRRQQNTTYCNALYTAYKAKRSWNANNTLSYKSLQLFVWLDEYVQKLLSNKDATLLMVISGKVFTRL